MAKTISEELTENDTEESKVANPVNPMLEFVKVKIPSDPVLKKEPIQVGINGKTYFVPRGTECSIPKPVAEVIANSFMQQEAADDLMDSLAQD